MDRIAQYRDLIIKAIKESYHYRFPQTGPEYEMLFLCDIESNQFMLYQTGWLDNKPVHDTIILARIKDGKIWIDVDWTEEGIATDLLRWGVPPSDIVLAFNHPTLREPPLPVLA